MKNLNINYTVSLMKSIDEFYIRMINPRIFALNLVYNQGAFFIEKRKYLDVFGDKELSLNEVFFLKVSDFDLVNIYDKLTRNNFDFNEEILEFGKHINIFGEEFEVTENFIDEFKEHFPDMIDSDINSLRIAKFNNSIIFLIYRKKERKLLHYDLSEFINVVIKDLKNDLPNSHSLYPKISNYEDIPSAKYTLIYNTNVYFIAKYFNLFEDIINKFYNENYDDYKEKTRKIWEEGQKDDYNIS